MTWLKKDRVCFCAKHIFSSDAPIAMSHYLAINKLNVALKAKKDKKILQLESRTAA